MKVAVVKYNAGNILRISLGKDNTYDDVNRIAEVLASVVK